MIYKCKACGAEISLSELDFEAAYFCPCGGMEMTFLRTDKGHEPAKKDVLTLIISGVRDHYKA